MSGHRDGGALRRPAPVERRRELVDPLREGDLVRWSGRFAVVEAVVTFAAAGTHVTISWADGGGLPMSVRLEDLSGCPHWRRVGEVGSGPRAC